MNISMMCIEFLLVPDSPTNIQVIGNPQAGYIQVSWGPPANPAGTLSEYRVYAQDAGILLNDVNYYLFMWLYSCRQCIGH